MSELPVNDLYDTFLNVVSFAFIGLLVWLYFKDFPKGGASEPDVGARKGTEKDD